MGKRSPILGYNHNIRHRGLVFHVQTEDSGVDNPHVFTHVFFGGVILNTRKLTYDGESAEDVVKSLMQAQHKALLKELKHGKLDAKIDQYLGDNPDLEPADPNAANLSPATPPVEPASRRHTSVSAAFDAITEDAVPQAMDGANTDVYSKPDSGKVSANAPTMLSPNAATRPQPAPRPPTPDPVVQAERKRSGPHRTSRSGTHRGSGVVVSRPAVIVSAPPKVVGKSGSRPARARVAREEKPSDGLFGQGLISEKSLDEVILAYLSDDAGEE